MPLKEYCAKFIGHTLFVQPYYGNGWHREEFNHPPNNADTLIGPDAFGLLVDDFLRLDNRRIGIRGKISETGHQFHGYWCLACLRSSEDLDFENVPGHYMIWIARNAPRFSPAIHKAIYEYVVLDKTAPCLCGYGTIAESPSRVK